MFHSIIHNLWDGTECVHFEMQRVLSDVVVVVNLSRDDLIIDIKMVVHCELYLCNINRLDIPEEVHLIWISQSTEYSNYVY